MTHENCKKYCTPYPQKCKKGCLNRDDKTGYCKTEGGAGMTPKTEMSCIHFGIDCVYGDEQECAKICPSYADKLETLPDKLARLIWENPGMPVTVNNPGGHKWFCLGGGSCVDKIKVEHGAIVITIGTP